MRKLVALLAVVAGLTGCPEKKEDYTKEKPQAEVERSKAPPPPVKKKAAAPADLGKCTLTVSGGITAEQTAVGGKASTNVAYWYKPEERRNMMGVDGYVVSCSGEKFRFQLLPGGGKLDGMPFTPKTFKFAKGKSDGASVMIAFGQATLSDATGVVDVTALDLRHIAGTVDLSGKVVPGNKQITIKGSFDYICPGLSACDFGDAPQ
ncbi:MAG: hypothetical protein IPQ07_26695 [Myxococcales bacterium]|jgi:hypothetical protein|nr:hypothetical protein [Myxococcales bacterium]